MHAILSETLRGVPLLVALCLGLSGVCHGKTGALEPSIKAPPALRAPLEEVPCWANFGVPRDTQCAWLSVPADRGEARGGGRERFYRLPVVIFRAATRTREPGPVLFINGGPGSPSFLGPRYGPVWSDLFQEMSWVGNRDLILFDQRGVGYADPVLDCPVYKATLLDVLARGGRDPGRAADMEELTALHQRLLRDCLDDIRAAGIAVGSFGTEATVADILDLRAGLGGEALNLWGASYGSRVAMMLMGQYPDGIRSAILESVFPPEEDNPRREIAGITDTLERIFRACAPGSACHRRHGDPEIRMERLMERLRRKPEVLRFSLPEDYRPGAVMIDDLMFVDLLFLSLYTSDGVLRLPSVLRAVEEEGIDALAPLMREWLIVGLGPLVDLGLNWAVTCKEERPRDPATMEEIARDFPLLGDWFLWYETLRPCAVWGTPPRRAPAERPIVSDVPTLLLAGQFDPATPPGLAERAAATLSRGRLVRVPEAAHDASMRDCPRRIMADFLNAPTEPVDTDCLASTGEMDFADPPPPR